MFGGNRPLRRAVRPGQPFGPVMQQKIQQANQLYQAGKPILAADMFAQLAAQALKTGHPRRAGNLNTRAAHAYVDGKNEALALTQSRSALSLFVQLQMQGRATQFFTNIQNHMQKAGMASALATLRQEFGAQIPTTSGPAQATPSPAKKGHLPSQCPGCGAPVRSDEVDWVDEQSAECAFCGSILISE